MPSPFPGMDPFLELPAYWPDFHSTFINYWREAVADRLPSDYEATLGERVYLVEHDPEARRLGYHDVAVTEGERSAAPAPRPRPGPRHRPGRRLRNGVRARPLPPPAPVPTTRARVYPGTGAPLGRIRTGGGNEPIAVSEGKRAWTSCRPGCGGSSPSSR